MSSKMKMGKAGIYGLAVLIIATALVMVAVVYPMLTNYVNTPGSVLSQPTPIVTNAPANKLVPISLALPYYIFNQTQIAAATENTQATLLGANQQTIIGSSSSGAAITGNVPTSDNGVAYLIVSPASAGTYGLLSTYTAQMNPNIVVGQPSVFMYQGQPWTMFQLNFGQLVSTTNVAVPLTFNIYGYAHVTPTLVSYTNATSISSTAYSYGTTTAYFNSSLVASFGSGMGYKITRMQVTLVNSSGLVNNATNAGYLDSGVFQLKSVTIQTGNGANPIVSTNLNWAGLSSAYYEVGAPTTTYLCGSTGTQTQQQFYGIPVLYGASDSSSTMQISMQWYGKLASAGDSITYFLKVFYITPTGSTASVTCTCLIS
jgi:hypothetical protein